MNTSQIYATIRSLAQVDETNFERVREFVIKLGEEPCEIFDSLWMQGYDGRKEIVELAKLNNSNDGGRKR